MTAYGQPLNTGTGSVKTAAEYDDDGGGVSRWHFWIRHKAFGEKTDAVATTPFTGSFSLISLIKALLGVFVSKTNATSTAIETTRAIKASPGVLYGISGYSDTTGWVLIHDKASVPTTGNVPVMPLPVEAGKPYSIDYGLAGRVFAVGISVGFSTTASAFNSGGAHMWVDAQYT